MIHEDDLYYCPRCVETFTPEVDQDCPFCGRSDCPPYWEAVADDRADEQIRYMKDTGEWDDLWDDPEEEEDDDAP